MAKKIVMRIYPKTSAKVMEECKEIFQASTGLTDLMRADIQVPPNKSWDIEARMEVPLEAIYFKCIHRTILHKGVGPILILAESRFHVLSHGATRSTDSH